MITTSCSSPQITDTQDMISSLETILLDREYDDSWYIVDRFKWSKLLGCSESVLIPFHSSKLVGPFLCIETIITPVLKETQTSQTRPSERR